MTTGTATIIDDLAAVQDLTRARARYLLDCMVTDPSDNINLGGFWEHEAQQQGYADTRLSLFWMPTVFAAWLDPQAGDLYHSETALAKIRLWLDFLRRRQRADGSIDMWGGGLAAAPEAAFAVPGLCASYQRIVASSAPGRDEICAGLEHYIRRVKDVIHTTFPFTSNHRWTAYIGPLAAAHQLFPEDRDAALIEDYLSDGIDIDSDGLYYEERSPNYNNVANWGLFEIADNWNRPDLLDLVERNLNLILAMRQPCGEAETIYSHRQDRGARGARGMEYWLFKRMAVDRNDGRFATAADMCLRAMQQGDLLHSFVPLQFCLDDQRYRNDSVVREPLPEQSEIRFAEAPLYRWRDGQVAMTAVADPGGHWWDITQGDWGGLQRSDAVMSYHVGGAIIDAIKMHWKGGTGGFRPEAIRYDNDGTLVLVYADPGWNHVAHFRPKDKWGPRHHPHNMAGSLRIKRDNAGAVTLDYSVTGWDMVPVSVELLIRENCQLGAVDAAPEPCTRRGRSVATGASYRVVGPDGSAIRIEGLPTSQHRMQLGEDRAITGVAEQRCHRLVFAGFSPLVCQLRLIPDPAGAEQ
ncbi:MAG: hypothetical protein PF961_02795 [Planctomycetota bacterium]|jgi:hypothetical protein|nr:hypothetical protein [Planctomycetota bacterium]